MSDKITILSNGAEYDHDQGRIVKGATLTSAQASELARTRWERARQATAESLVDLRPSNKTEYDGWKMIIKKQAQLAMTPTDKTANASVRAAEFIGRAADFIPDRRNSVQNDGDTTTITAQIPKDVLLALVAQAQAKEV